MLRPFAFVSALAVGAVAATAAAAGGVGCATCYRRVVEPPVYETVAEKVMLRAPRTYNEVIPGEVQTIAEKVLVAPPRRFWKVTYGPNGEMVGCWVEKPAQFAVRHRTVMVRPPQVVPRAVPAVWGIQQRTVMVQPARAAGCR